MNTKPLSKDFYSFIIFFLSIMVIGSLIQSVALLNAGNNLMSMNSFFPWLWWFVGVILVANAALVRYFLHQGHRFVAITLIICLIPGLTHLATILNVDFRVMAQAYYNWIVYCLWTTNIVFGISLILIKSQNSKWLKIAGFMQVIYAIVQLVIFYMYFNSGNYQFKLTLVTVGRWVTVFEASISICMLIYFWRENKRMGSPDHGRPQTAPALLKLAAFIGLLFFGFNFSLEATQRSAAYKPTSNELRKAKLVEEHHFVDQEGDTLPYRFLKPLEYDSTRQYPLVVCLHHGGTHGKDNIHQLTAEPAPFLMEPDNREKYRSFIFMPQSPEGTGFHSLYGSTGIDSLVFRAIRQLQDSLPIDPKRIYVLGISGGGYGSWHFISAHPEVFAAAIPICGGGDPKYGPKLTNVPIWAFHGARDKLAPVAHSRDMIAAIRKAGGHPKYTEYAFSGHDIWDKVEKEGIMEWMFAQHKP